MRVTRGPSENLHNSPAPNTSIHGYPRVYVICEEKNFGTGRTPVENTTTAFKKNAQKSINLRTVENM